MNTKNKSNHERKTLVIGGFIGFLVGILGNLIASWIQQDLLANSFTPFRIGIIICLSVMGILIAQRYESLYLDDSSGSKNDVDVTIKTGRTKDSKITGISTSSQTIGNTSVSIETKDIDSTTIKGVDQGNSSQHK